MIYIVMIVVVSLLVGPILWMRPTAGQNDLSKLRMAAISAGLTVQIPRDDELLWCRGIPHVSKHRLTRYMLPLHTDSVDKTALHPVIGLYKLNAERKLWFRNEDQALTDELSVLIAPMICDAASIAKKGDDATSLPSSMTASAQISWPIALEIKQGSLAVYWMENGSEADVMRIGDALKAVRELFV